MALLTKSPKAGKHADEASAPGGGTGTTGVEEVEFVPTYEWPDPAKPSALLLPQYVRERRANAKTRKLTFYGVIASVSIIALLAVGASVMHLKASSDRSEAENSLAAAQKQVDAYAPVATYYDGLSARQVQLVTELSGDVAYSKLLGSVVGAVPSNGLGSGTSIGKVEFFPGTPCQSPDPFAAEPLIGCMKLSVSAATEDEILGYFEALKNLPEGDNLAQAFIATLSNNSGSGFEATISVNYGPGALSNRFVPKAEDGTPLPPTGVAPGAAPGAPAAPADPNAGVVPAPSGPVVDPNAVNEGTE